jgi:hypothetical protein
LDIHIHEQYFILSWICYKVCTVKNGDSTRKNRHSCVSKNFDTQTCENDMFACEIHTHVCRFLNIFLLRHAQYFRTDAWVRLWHARVWFPLVWVWFWHARVWLPHTWVWFPHVRGGFPHSCVWFSHSCVWKSHSSVWKSENPFIDINYKC